jgi:UDP-N-acetylmuramate dehydrogenase
MKDTYPQSAPRQAQLSEHRYLVSIQELSSILSRADILQDEPMANHTTFRVGGLADFFLTPQTYHQLAGIISLAQNKGIPYFIIGKGSNLIVLDGGIRGLVISTEKLNKIVSYDRHLLAECGAELKDLSAAAAEQGLSGLEFSCGIPGSVGGAVYMNAGAYEGEISQVLDYTLSLDFSASAPSVKQDSSCFIANLQDISCSTFRYRKQFASDLALGYRSSKFQSSGLVLLYAIFALKPAEKSRIQTKIAELTQARNDKQPLDLPSAGSVFKRPSGHFAGKLIADSGLRGFRIGDAAVSEKHCGFIVNLDKATAADVLAVIAHVQKTVFQRFAVQLQTEVKVIGSA